MNDRKAYTDSYSPEDGWYDGGYVVKVFDVNPSDKYKEIEITLNFCWEYYQEYHVLRYSDKKLKMLFSTWLEPYEKQKKNNKVQLITVVYCALGMPSCVIDYKIKNQKVKKALPKDGIVKLTDGHLGSDYWYTAARSINVYKKPNAKTRVKKLEKGDEFRVTKIKFVKGEPKYAYIDTLEAAKVGWIDISGDNWWEINLVSNPLAYG